VLVEHQVISSLLTKEEKKPGKNTIRLRCCGKEEFSRKTVMVEASGGIPWIPKRAALYGVSLLAAAARLVERRQATLPSSTRNELLTYAN
jgi:hypothetical protein